MPELLQRMCRICESRESVSGHQVREMMFGTKESFTYYRCARCHSMEISEQPVDLSRHYAENYYSFAGDPSARGRLRAYAHRARALSVLWGRGGLIGRLMSKRYPDPLLESLRLLELKKHMRILDVGCGSGAMIYTLGGLGFARVLGIDPFIDEDRVYGNGTEIRKQSLSELDERFDVIMFHHSFEHMDDPAGILGNVARLLDDGGTCVINTPNANSDAWENYGTDWVQLDAPRHLFIHSPEGLAGLATRAGLEVRDVRWNSTAFQFWGSEQYRLNIPLNDPKSHAVDTAASPFSAEQIRLWDARARELNEARRGDQFAAYLVKR